jgi:transposase
MTQRLSQALLVIGLTTCGKSGAGLAKRLGMFTSSMTILRRIMRLPAPRPSCIKQLGIDDWAFRRGHTYGTILVDLEKHTIIDLLPDRGAFSATQWMQAHPDITVVSRDRSGEYTMAAMQGAPQAQQVADRFHLVVRRIGACLIPFGERRG